MILPDCISLRESLRGALEKSPAPAGVPEGFQRAAVLVPLAANGTSECELILTKRTEEVERHKGQVSFPGGVADHSDRNLVETALREAEEELAIPRGAVETLGALDDLVIHTGFVVTPIVGIVKPGIPFSANPLEVAEVFQVPLSFFADPRSGHSETREHAGVRHEVWFYDDGCHIIWGATAAIIRSLLKKLGLL